jgi:Flp pilus assembly protein TadD
MEASVDHATGLALASAGRLDEAEAIFQRLLDADPADPEALHFFGVLSGQRSDPEAAESYLRRAIDARPGWAKPWNSLGAVLHSQGKNEAALTACREAVRHDPAAGDCQYNLGLALYLCGRTEAAAESLYRASVAESAAAEAFDSLGRVVKNLLRRAQSEAARRRANEICSHYAGAYNDRGVALRREGRYADAETNYRRAIELVPLYAEAHNNLGIALRRQGRYADAEAAFRRAIELAPDVASFHGNLANLLRILGEFADAEAAYRRSIELDPTHTEPYRMLAGLTPIGADDPLMARMQSLAGTGSLLPERQINLHFALGKALETQKDFDAAFHHWSAGGRLQRSILKYDDAVREAAAQRIMAVFNRQFLERNAGGGCPSSAPIFVLGMPRSGTTLIEQILASPSAVEAGGELGTLQRLAAGSGFPDAFADADPEGLRALGEAYIAETGLSLSERFTDKLPENFLRIGLIHLILPNARIVHCRRDPVDTCLSCYCQKFRGVSQPYSYDLHELGLEYRRYERLMEHWGKMSPGTVHEIRYEELIDDQEGETRRLLAYCDLPFEDACLRFFETARVVETASANQVRQNLYRTATGRWKQYEAHLEPLLAVLGA